MPLAVLAVQALKNNKVRSSQLVGLLLLLIANQLRLIVEPGRLPFGFHPLPMLQIKIPIAIAMGILNPSKILKQAWHFFML
jgi:hypothetical protein